MHDLHMTSDFVNKIEDIKSGICTPPARYAATRLRRGAFARVAVVFLRLRAVIEAAFLVVAFLRLRPAMLLLIEQPDASTRSAVFFASPAGLPAFVAAAT